MCQEFVPRQLTQEWREQYYASHSQAPIDEELFECMMLETYARERVKELREALDKYGEHSSICDKWSRPNFGGPYICTCGFEAVLTRMK